MEDNWAIWSGAMGWEGNLLKSWMFSVIRRLYGQKGKKQLPLGLTICQMTAHNGIVLFPNLEGLQVINKLSNIHQVFG